MFHPEEQVAAFLRIAMFPAIDPDDVAILTHAIDYLAEALR